ncbi:LOW QUALITY PROTEIN: Reverse transcriptase [Phytophthora palmivora]|uniref:Reverse transcriptase n=1 Tax=Phytophthora palmivora TaxID=4796 RepID=A0A2P4YBY3_9STRA|nr:LOW QUALITY PROTEIN: Reverse transcriptase [Phytophthora palmivora]
MEMHLKHLRRVFEVMRANKLYANIDKRVFTAEEINDLGWFGRRSREGQVHSGMADPEVTEGPPVGLANYLHKYSAGYAELARPLSDLLKKDADWHQDACNSIKASLQFAPVLAQADKNYTPMVRFLSEGKDAKDNRL